MQHKTHTKKDNCIKFDKWEKAIIELQDNKC